MIGDGPWARSSWRARWRASRATGAGRGGGGGGVLGAPPSASAALLITLSGPLTLDELVSRARRTAYVDVDPGFTQFWHADPATPFTVDGYDVYFTVGENIGAPDCPVPTAGVRWLPTRQPVVLADWPVCRDPGGGR